MDKIIKKHFVFDLDDTLIDSHQFNQQMFVNLFAPYLDIKELEIENYLRDLHYKSKGTSMRSQFEEVIKYFSLNISLVDIIRENEELQIKNVDDIGILDAVEEVIKILKDKGKNVSICSNRQTQSLVQILKKHNIFGYFTYIVSCIDEGHEKPDPYCLIEMIKKSKEPKENFIYFGDSITDFQFAKNADVDFIIIDHYLNQKKFYKMIVQSFM